MVRIMEVPRVRILPLCFLVYVRRDWEWPILKEFDFDFEHPRWWKLLREQQRHRRPEIDLIPEKILSGLVFHGSKKTATPRCRLESRFQLSTYFHTLRTERSAATKSTLSEYYNYFSISCECTCWLLSSLSWVDQASSRQWKFDPVLAGW